MGVGGFGEGVIDELGVDGPLGDRVGKVADALIGDLSGKLSLSFASIILRMEYRLCHCHQRHYRGNHSNSFRCTGQNYPKY